MAIIISDTNIFVDLYNTELLDYLFSLTEEIHTVKQVLFELIDKKQSESLAKFISDGKLFIKSFDFTELAELYEFSTHCSNRLSEPDIAVVFYGHQTNGVILSGDRRLRSKAESIGIEVHGILYVVKRLVTDGIITVKIAINALEKLINSNPRLPKSDIDQLIDDLQKNS